jgi:hypothetical protein
MHYYRNRSIQNVKKKETSHIVHKDYFTIKKKLLLKLVWFLIFSEWHNDRVLLTLLY